MNYETLPESFKSSIDAIAEVANMSGQQVYDLWRKYSKQCSDGDQSPILFEFVRWYAAELGGNMAALDAAIN